MCLVAKFVPSDLSALHVGFLSPKTGVLIDFLARSNPSHGSLGMFCWMLVIRRYIFAFLSLSAVRSGCGRG